MSPLRAFIYVYLAGTFVLAGVTVHLGNRLDQTSVSTRQQASAKSLKTEASAAQTEALAYAATFEKWAGLWLDAGSCSPDHPLPKARLTTAEYLTTDAARYCREQAMASMSLANAWKDEANDAKAAVAGLNIRADSAVKAKALSQYRFSQLLTAMSATAVIIAMALQIITMILMNLMKSGSGVWYIHKNEFYQFLNRVGGP